MSKKHTILMLACCLIGMGAVLAVFAFKVPVNNVFFGLMLLLCPLSHLFMMKGMLGHDHLSMNEEHQHGVDAQVKPAVHNER